MSDFKDILNDAHGQELSEEQLMAYLEGRLSPEEQHAVEAQLAMDGMESDAVEGLQTLGAEDTRQMQRKLNLELSRNLKRKKHRRREGPATQRWTAIAILLIILLAVIGFVIIRMRVG